MTKPSIDFSRLVGFDVPMTATTVDFRDDALADGAGAKVGKGLSPSVDFSKLVGFDAFTAGAVDFRADGLADHAGAKVSKPETTRKAS